MKKLLQNRIVVGLICIVVALVICFGLTPMFNDALKSKVEIVRVSTEIKKGDEITPKMLTTVEVGGYNLPGNVVYKAEDVIGKYANTDLYKGDYVLESKLSDTPQLKNEYLTELDGTKRAISVTIKSFAAGLSGKLERGDIVSLIASDVGEARQTLIPAELQYVEIIATTASSGTDNNVQEERSDLPLPSPSLPRQNRQGSLRSWSRPGNFMPLLCTVAAVRTPGNSLMNRGRCWRSCTP